MIFGQDEGRIVRELCEELHACVVVYCCRVSRVAASAGDHVKGKIGRRAVRWQTNRDDDPQLLADLPWPPLLLLHRSPWSTLFHPYARLCMSILLREIRGYSTAD